MLRKIQLPTFPEPLSAVCLGTARFGGDYDEARSFALMDQYYAMGGRFFDTANVYGRWSGRTMNESELTIGRWMRERQITDVVVTSKCVHYMPDRPNVSRVNRECAMRDLDESRRSLGMDVIPIYLTHRDNRDVDIRVIVDFMAEMVQKGMVTRFGFSNYAADRVAAAIDYMGDDWREMFVGVSNEWSLHLETKVMERGGHIDGNDGLVMTDTALWNLHRERRIPLIPFSAAAHGFYAKVKHADELSKAEQRVYVGLTEESVNNGISVNSLSVAYLLNAGIPCIPVMAVSSEQQLREFEEIAWFKGDLNWLGSFER
ncbi:MAG: aldo/keto reductase [Clostridia bacterium]|nr:aldo/keto reductase [Clostridia bacterium]